MANIILVPESARPVPARATLRSFTEADRDRVLRLLTVLPLLYPGGADWLVRRLDEVRSGGPVCTLIELSGNLAGVSIETPKSLSSIKLSTFFIDDRFRRQGLGLFLARSLVNRWRAIGVNFSYVTVAHTRSEALLSCLGAVGFEYADTEPHRYGEGRHEVILQWRDSSKVPDLMSSCPFARTMRPAFSMD
ncbi:hypothetical protein HX744_09535 [Pseudonocardia sp. ICBG1122]|nr:hypothetical protein [Pseudonocardia pini]